MLEVALSAKFGALLSGKILNLAAQYKTVQDVIKLMNSREIFCSPEQTRFMSAVTQLMPLVKVEQMYKYV